MSDTIGLFDPPPPKLILRVTRSRAVFDSEPRARAYWHFAPVGVKDIDFGTLRGVCTSWIKRDRIVLKTGTRRALYS